MKNVTLKFLLTIISIFSIQIVQAQISTATITVNDTAIAPTSVTASKPSFCNGDSSTLTTVGGELGSGSSAQWVWYEDACGTGTPIGTGPSITVKPPNTTTATITKTYYVRSEGAICGNSICTPVSVDVFATPTVTAPADIVLCNGATNGATSLTGSPTGITYDITGGATVGLANATGVTQIPSFTATNSGTAAISATVTITPNANGCTGSPVTYTITVLPTVTMVTTSNQIKCNNTPTAAVTFSSSATSGTVTYSWTNDNTATGLAASGSGDISSFTATNTTCADITSNITVTPTYSDGTNTCTGTPSVFQITVHPSPNGTLTAISSSICEGSTAELKYTSTCAGSPSPYTIEVRQDSAATNTTYSNVVNGTAFSVTPVPSSGTHTYDLMKITDDNGCIRQ